MRIVRLVLVAIAVVPVLLSPAPAMAAVPADNYFPIAGYTRDPHCANWYGEAADHWGTDCLAPTGTKLIAVEAGFIYYTRAGQGYDCQADTGDRSGNNLSLLGASGSRYYYGHLDRLGPGLAYGIDYNAGDRVPVTKGQVIGYVGATGNACDVPHLHIQVWDAGVLVNPYPLMGTWIPHDGTTPPPPAPSVQRFTATSGGTTVSGTAAGVDLAVPALGGPVALGADVSNATSVTFASSPALSGLPRTVSVSGGRGTATITLGANRSLATRTFGLTVQVAGPGGTAGSGLRIRLVQRAVPRVELVSGRQLDFNGDGRTDVFTVAGNQWMYSSGGVSGWTDLASSTIPLADLRFGDFNGDGRTDVFTASGNQWMYASAGQPGWTELASSTIPLANLRFGDFNADGRTDVFTVSGTQWMYSSGGVSGWTDLTNSTIPLGNLRFGDFNADGRTDVFTVSGTQWMYANGGQPGWTDLATSTTLLANLRFGDFNADGRTDVFTVAGTQWMYANGGQPGWTDLANSTIPLANLRFG